MENEKNGQEPDSLADTLEFQALKLTEQTFVLEYIKDFNGTRAAIAAGLGSNEASSASIASQLLKKVKIQAAIALATKHATKVTVKKYDISREALLNILAEIAHADTKEMVKINKGRAKLIRPKSLAALKSFSYSESDGSQGQSTSFSFAVHDRGKIVETIAKMTGVLNETESDKPRNTSSLKSRATDLLKKVTG